MTGQGNAVTAPDPSWSAAVLLEQAEGCDSLSAAWLAPLAALDPSALAPDEQLALALVLHRMVAVTEALSLTALGCVPDRRCRPDPALALTHPEAAARKCAGGRSCRHHWQTEELAALTGASLWGTRRQCAWSRELVTGAWAPLLPLLTGGQLSTEHLRRFERATTNASVHAVTAAVQAVLDAVAHARRRGDPLGVEVLARTVRKTVALHTTPEEAVEAHRKTAREQTGTAFTDLSDGLAVFTLTGDTIQMEALRALVHHHPAVTHPQPGETRTRGQLQVDLILSLCLHPTTGLAMSTGVVRTAGATGAAGTNAAGPGSTGGASSGEWPVGSRGAATPDVGVIITASRETLLGLSNQPARIGDTLIPAALARHWAANPAWARRAIHDHHGTITTVSRKQRFPNTRLRRAVEHRWQSCTFPGCTRRATEIEIDHADPHGAGGHTLLQNLHPLCPRHHLYKEQPGVHLQLTDHGTAIWTLPGGRTITTHAPDHRPQPAHCCATATLDTDAETPNPDNPAVEPGDPGPQHHDNDPDYQFRVYRNIRHDAARAPEPFPDRQPPPDNQPPPTFDWDTWATNLIARDPQNAL